MATDYRALEQQLIAHLATTRRPIAITFRATAPAGVAAPSALLARPTCMALPAALAQGVLVSTACVGNRVYTDLGDDELYLAIPGRALAPLAAELGTITTANATLREYHAQRRSTLATN